MRTFTLYGRENCGYCDKAKKLILAKGYEFDYKPVTEPENRSEVLRRAPNATTVPQIFEGDTYIGGHDQLVEFFNKEGNTNE